MLRRISSASACFWAADSASLSASASCSALVSAYAGGGDETFNDMNTENVRMPAIMKDNTADKVRGVVRVCICAFSVSKLEYMTR